MKYFLELALVVGIPSVWLLLFVQPWVIDWQYSQLPVRISQEKVVVAKQVVRFVNSSSQAPGDLGQWHFTQREVDHLVDVRAVFSRLRSIGIGSLVVISLLLVSLRKDGKAVGWGVKLAGGVLLIAAISVVIVSLTAWSWWFDWLHGWFFAPDSWKFYADDLLIQLFPERFWMEVGGAYVGSLGVVGGGLVVVGRRMLNRHLI